MKISQRANSIEQSLSRKLFNLAKDYDNVIDLTLGDPDIAPSTKIKDAACNAIYGNKIRYSANAGLPLLRTKISEVFDKEYGINVEPNENIIVTVGGMEALFLSLACMIDNGDEVIILGPYYVNYKQMVSMCGGVPVIVNSFEENGFLPQIEQIERAISNKTVAIIINSPSNPTGVAYDKKTLSNIADIAKKYNLIVISDEVYRTLVFENQKHESIINVEGMQERTIVVDSISKRFAMTGYRVGYAVGPKEIISNMVKMQENVAACAPVSSQYAAITAYEECSKDIFIKNEFEQRRNYLFDAINRIEGLSCIKPQATFYLFVNIEKTNMSGLDFAYKLLEEEQVAVVPGITYGVAYDKYIRIAFTVKENILQEATERIERFMKKIIKGV